MTYPLRYFAWIKDEAESAALQAQGARICEGCLETHHAHYAVLHELPAHIAQARLEAK